MSDIDFVSLYDAGQVRTAQLGERLLALEADDLPTAAVEQSILDLYGGLEQVAQLPPDSPLQLAERGYLVQTYGLGGVGLDPFLRAQLPPVPALGAQVRPFVLRTSPTGPVLRVSAAGPVLRVGARLVPNVAPVFNTPLLPTQTVGALAYNGLAGTVLAFNGPLPAGTFASLYLKLYVATGPTARVLVGTVDFPASLLNQGFSLFYQGDTYYGTFQQVPTNELLLAL